MEPILLFIPSAVNTVLSSTSSLHCDSAAAMATTVIDLDSPISLSSGYCSDDDGDERAAVRPGGDFWMPSTVVEKPPMSVQKTKRRHHLERGQDNGHSYRYRYRPHSHASSQSTSQEVALSDCLDPLRILGVDDTFAVADEALRLPLLQIDPRLVDCSDDDDGDVTLVGCVSETSAVLSPHTTTDIRCDGEWLSQSESQSAEVTALISGRPFCVDSWLHNVIGGGDNEDCSVVTRTAEKDGEFETCEQLGEAAGNRLLVELLLGQATYRTTTASDSRHDAGNSGSTVDSTVPLNCDTSASFDGGTSGTDRALNNDDLVVRRTSGAPRQSESVCPEDIAAIASNSTDYSPAVKKIRFNDVITSVTCNESDDFSGSKVRKLSTGCREESRESFSVASTSPSSRVTSSFLGELFDLVSVVVNWSQSNLDNYHDTQRIHQRTCKSRANSTFLLNGSAPGWVALK